MPDEFASLLPTNSTPWERSVEQASGERWDDMDIDVIRRFKDPWTCPAHLLNFLAFERSVDIWDETWPELKKRSVIASAPADHRIKGTLAGTRRYLEIAGARLMQTVRAPQGFFASPGLTKDELDAHIAKHPKVRIVLAHGTGVALDMDGFFVGDGFCDHDTTGVDDGPALYGRRAYLVQDGVSTPLQVTRIVTEETERIGVVTERVNLPGKAVAMSFAGHLGAGVGFADAWDVPPRSYTVNLDRAYRHSDSTVELSLVSPGYGARDIRYRRESEIGDASEHVFADFSFAEFGFAGRNDAPDLLADVLYLVDPTIPSPVTSAGGFADHDRVGMAPHIAEMQIDWQQFDDGPSFYVEAAFAGNAFAETNDTSRHDFLIGAVASSKRLSDRIGVTFQKTRPRTLNDGIPLDGSYRIGDRVPFSL